MVQIESDVGKLCFDFATDFPDVYLGLSAAAGC